MKKKLHPELFLAGGISIFILLLIFFVKGIYPFGEDNIATQDMIHGYLPVYYHLYDFLHGEKSLFFDWYTGTGVNMVGIASANGLLCPTNLILLLFPRDKLLYAMSILYLFKVFLAAISAQWFFKKRFPAIGTFGSVFAATMYSLSGFCLYYYFQLIWLDIVILFPIVVYSAEILFRKGKILPLIISLFACVTASFYMGMMVIICLFFAGGLYILVYLDGTEKNNAIVRLGIATALGVLLSAFINLPAYLQMSGSSRYGSTASFTSQNLGFVFDRDKAALFVGLQACVFFCILLATKYNKHQKTVTFCVGAIAYTFLPFIIEGADLIWHFGSYNSFPMRFAFMSIFFIILGSVVYLDKFGDEVKKIIKSPVIVYISSVVAFALWCVYIYYMCHNFGKKLIDYSKDKTAFTLGLGSYIIGCIVMLIFSQLPSKDIRRYAMSAMCLVEVFFFGIACIGTSSLRANRTEHNTDYVALTESIDTEKIDDYGVLDRVKNSDMSLNINYPFILKASAVNNWTHQIPNRLQNTMEMLGYSSTYTLLLDTGGTTFGEMLTGTKAEITKNADDSFTISDCEFVLPSVFTTTADLSGFDINSANPGTSSAFAYQNRLYSALSGESSDLFTIVNKCKKQTEKTLVYEFTLAEKSEIYLAAGRVSDNSFTVTVNGEKIQIPTYKAEDNELFPREYFEGVLNLGTFEGVVTVQLDFQNTASSDNISFGVCSCSKLTALCDKINSENEISYTSGKRSLSITVLEHTGNTLYIPVNFDDGWTAEIDGEKAEIACVVGSFMAVTIPDGECIVELKFTPSGMNIGIAVSIVALALTVIVYLLNKKKFIENVPEILPEIVGKAFAFVFIAASFGVYIGPLIIDIINSFKG